MTLAMVESSSGAASAQLDVRGEELGGGREHQHPAYDRVELVEPEPEPGGHPEVAAAAADGPEQVRVGLGVHVQDAAVRRHDLGGQQVVDGQAVLSHEITPLRRQG
jgi:hypothetical protein